MADRGNEEAIRIARIDVDHRDHLSVGQSQMRPVPAAVGRLVHAVAGRQIGTNDARARTGVNDFRIGWRYRKRADRSGGLTIEQRLPVGAIVRGPPNPAIIET